MNVYTAGYIKCVILILNHNFPLKCLSELKHVDLPKGVCYRITPRFQFFIALDNSVFSSQASKPVLFKKNHVLFKKNPDRIRIGFLKKKDRETLHLIIF